MPILWFLTLLSTLLAALVVLFTTATGQSAPQQAAGYALACALAVVPYVFTRAAQAIKGPDRGESTRRIVESIERSRPKAE